MTEIAIELVPRTHESLQSDLTVIQTNFPAVSVINIPDLISFKLRSWDACRGLCGKGFRLIPHVRAIDVNPGKPFAFTSTFRELGIRDVLVIGGDRPNDFSRNIYANTTIDVIKKFRRELPEVAVFAGIDQFRTGFRTEYDYIHRKLEAGASGFFTQPFFDLRLMEMYAELLHGTTVFWGITPITGRKSRNYWESKNLAIFPRDFSPKLAWNRHFADSALAFVRSIGANIYFMPIRMDLVRYLGGIVTGDRSISCRDEDLSTRRES